MARDSTSALPDVAPFGAAESPGLGKGEGAAEMRFAPACMLFATIVLRPGTVGVPASSAQDGLARALDSILSRSIRSDLGFVASDELEGRDSPSRGLRVAALFLAARLERLGFTPAGMEGFLQPYEVSEEWPGADSRAEFCFEGEPWTTLAFGEDYSFSEDDFQSFDHAGELIAVGDLTEIPAVDLAGRWALATADGSRGRSRGNELRERRALGLVLAQGEREYGVGSPPYAGRGLHVIRESPALPIVLLTRSGTEKILPGGTPSPGELLGMRFHERRAPRPSGRLDNVAGLWPGRHPERACEVLLVSVHYDHLGRKGDTVFPGANDNGSGTCALLAVAEALAILGPLERSVLLLWVSGEEQGLRGSLAWTMAPRLPEGMHVVAAINVDGIGRGAIDELRATPSPAHPAYGPLAIAAGEAASREGFEKLASADASWTRSDHWNYHERLGVPVVAFLEAAVSPDYHTPEDTPDKVDCDRVRRVARTVVRLLHALQSARLGS